MIIIGDNGRPNDFPDSRIHWIFGCFGTLSVLANIMFLFLPKHKLKNCIESVQMANTLKSFLNRKVLLLSFSWIHLGIFTSFWLGPFPTSLLFTNSLNNEKNLIPLYACSLAIGEVIIGFITSYFATKIDDFGQLPTALIGFTTNIICFLLVLISIPCNSTLFPNEESALLIEPKLFFFYYIALFCGFLLGIGDGCWNTVRCCIITALMPKRRAYGFCISKLFQVDFFI
ncbi:unnamed protein product [Dracunculus medinensis]|uniref:Uncharacterized protein n=1 Tax=Dracunculus medinensis TaxID=318479 RepID=A0A0N4U6H9_DRAME|nr:unnamed protein product [Dracunculus medinensis]